MAFYGCSFVFDGVPSERYGLVLYDMSSSKQSQTSFVDNTFVEDRISRRYDPLFYGQTMNDQLSFKLTFGLHPNFINSGKYFDRYDFERIASWLTGRDGYKWLEICGDDTSYIRYRCKLSGLEVVQAGIYPQVLTCNITCDSPFGYTRAMKFSYTSTTTLAATLHSRSTYNGLYKPMVVIKLNGASSASITNSSDNGLVMSFADIPAAFQNATLTIDCQNQIITSSTGDNMYPYSNKRFLRLVRGDNNLTIAGNCNIDIMCCFPINVGG